MKDIHFLLRDVQSLAKDCKEKTLEIKDSISKLSYDFKMPEFMHNDAKNTESLLTLLRQ